MGPRPTHVCLFRETRLLPPKAGRLASRSAKPTLDGSSLNRQDKTIHILGPPRNQQPRSLTCALPSTRCARRSSPASRAAHFSRSSSSWRSAGARLCSAASSPRCHRLRRTEGHYACTAHERSLYSPVFAAASPASTQLPRTLIPQVASGCSGTNIYGRAAPPRDQAFCDFSAISP